MLYIEGLEKRYGDRRVLQGLNLQIPDGEIYGLLGPNGAGKTTTINILSNLLRADAGTVLINGHPVSERTKPWLGIAPQENLVYRSLTCAENLDFFGRLYGLSAGVRRRRVAECLAAVGLGDRASSPAERLSGGMLRRLSLAIALIHQPKLVVLDEPTTGLDIEARYELWELIRTLQRQGMTVLLTTHLLDEAERLCDRIGFLRQGTIPQEGTLAELRQLIPAQEILTLQTGDEAGAIARAKTLGFPCRRYGSDLAFWLPQPLELPEIIRLFEGVPLEAIARQPVRLEHIYLEITNPPPDPSEIPQPEIA